MPAAWVVSSHFPEFAENDQFRPTDRRHYQYRSTLSIANRSLPFKMPSGWAGYTTVKEDRVVNIDLHYRFDFLLQLTTQNLDETNVKAVRWY